MFQLPLWQMSMTTRTGPGQWLAEFVATFGLLLTILGCAARNAGGNSLCGRPVHHLRLLVHGVDVVCESRRDHRPLAVRHFRRHRARRRRCICCRATRRHACRRAVGPLVLDADKKRRRMTALPDRRIVIPALGIAQIFAWGSTFYLPAAEAIVVEANGDMLTLRWRDYPRERRIVRHRLRLGLLYPGPRPTKKTGNQRKPQPTQSTTNPSQPIWRQRSSLPKDWDEIDINHFVLAKDDSHGGRGGKPSRSRKPATSSSSAGARICGQRPADHAATARLGADLPERRLTQNLMARVSNRPEPPSAAARNDLICGPFRNRHQSSLARPASASRGSLTARRSHIREIQQ